MLESPFGAERKDQVFFRVFRKKPFDGRCFPDVQADIIQVVIGGDIIPFSFPGENDRIPVSFGQREGKTLLLPRCLDAGRMEALPVKDLSEVSPGTLGIPEPVFSGDKAGIPEPDLIIVPCMTAAPCGVRLGHGAGYYDRFLAEHSGTTVCLCFQALMRADLPAEDTDIPMDHVITD